MTALALADANNFYASCERVFNPKLQGKPVIVLSNNDGSVIARSNEAKALGIQMAHPFFKIRDLVKREKVQVFSSNFELYGDMSRRLMRLLESFTPSLEIYSIDEAFLSLKGIPSSDFRPFALSIRSTVLQGLGLPISIGVGPTKTLTKVAGYFAKKSPEFKGVCSLYDFEDPSFFLARLPVGEVWGVGRQYQALLLENGIDTALKLRDTPLPWIKKKMGIMGVRLVEELRGTPCFPLEEFPSQRKSLVVSRTFSRPTDQLFEIREAISTFVLRGSEKLRHHGLVAKSLMVFMRTNRFTQIPQHSGGMTLSLEEATQHPLSLLREALKGVDTVFRSGFLYNKAGICLADLSRADEIQSSLFLKEEHRPSEKLTEAIDRVNRIFGKRSLFFGATGLQRAWISRAECRSPRFTTRWDELLTI